MQRFKRVLVAATPGYLQSSDIEVAVKLATTNHASLTFMDTIAAMRRWQKSVNIEGRVVDVEAALRADREEGLRTLVEAGGAATSAEVVIAQGEPFLELIRRVISHDHDLVMMAEPAQDDASHNRMSSGVMHVLRKCPVPVWVLRRQTQPTSRVLALVDPDPDDPVRDGLADLVMQLATSQAQWNNAELHVGNAWRLQGENTLRNSPRVGLPGELVDAMVSQSRTTQDQLLRELVDRHGTATQGVDRPPTQVHLVPGAARDALPPLAARLGPDLVVMGTVGRTGLRGLIMGNSAETILQSVNCSVLAVKPDGFVSPVKG